MRRYLISCTAIAAVALLLSQPLAAQDKEKDKDKDKLGENEQLIIKKKGDKDTKVTIEIKGDEVTVNGKPLDEFDDDNVVIKKGKANGFALAGPRSPYRSGTWSYSDNFSGNGNTAFLGVVTEKADKSGAKIEEITEGSAADKAGLKEGDVITKIDDANITSPEDLTKVIHKHKAEDKVTISYERNGKSEKTTATLGKNKAMAFNFEGGPRFNMTPMPDFNFEWPNGENFHNFSMGGRPRLGIKAQDTEDGKGVKVLDVDDESAAGKAGIKEDDIITEFDGKKVNTAQELASAAREAKDKPSVKITFIRDGKTQTVEVKTPKKLRTADL
jgi:serine protease Do